MTRKNPIDASLPLQSASQNDSSFAPFVNPVFSDIFPNPSISYIVQFPDSEINPNHYLLTDIYGFLFSYARINHQYNYYNTDLESAHTNLFTLGKGFLFGNILGIGLNYSFTGGGSKNFDDYKSLTLGLLIRPLNFISLGYVARDLNGPEVYGAKISRSGVYSLSIRPLYNLTFSFDAVQYGDHNIDKSDMLFSTALLFKYNIKASAAVSMNKDFSFGLIMPFGINPGGSGTLILDANYFKRDKGYSSLGITFTGEKSRSTLAEGTRFLKIKLDRDISEIRKAESIFSRHEIIFYDLVHAVDAAGNDGSIAGIILEIDEADLGFGQLQELREQIKIFRSRGKEVYSILNAMGNKEYYLASAGSKIYYNPANLFSITGLKAEVFFFKKGLDKLGVKFEAVKRGAYKSFPEPYTREHMSPEFRENMISLLTDLNEQYLGDIQNDRAISKDKIDKLLNRGLMLPEEALKAGFIDGIEYPADAEKKILDENSLPERIVDLSDYTEEKIMNYQWGPIPEIAVIHVSGSIVHGDSGGLGGLTGALIGDTAYYKALTDAFKNLKVKAVIIRVDSGGGSSLASELMWHYLESLKREYPKPVIFSFGNIAASGGYYIACTGDQILGDRGTITGSIGVITGKLSLKELYAKLGINKDIIKMSEFADIFSEAKDMSAEERKVIEQGVDYVYNRFTDKVAESRKMEKEQVEKLAEGRVFTGGQAKNNGLIDSYGGLVTAIELAKKITKIKNEYAVSHFPETPTPLMGLLGLEYTDNLLKKFGTLLKTLEIAEFKDEFMLYYFPYKIDIK